MNVWVSVSNGTVAPSAQNFEWQRLVSDIDDSWRSVAGHIMSVYQYQTHGAFVQTKGSSMLFNYVESDP